MDMNKEVTLKMWQVLAVGIILIVLLIFVFIVNGGKSGTAKKTTLNKVNDIETKTNVQTNSIEKQKEITNDYLVRAKELEKIKNSNNGLNGKNELVNQLLGNSKENKIKLEDLGMDYSIKNKPKGWYIELDRENLTYYLRIIGEPVKGNYKFTTKAASTNGGTNLNLTLEYIENTDPNSITKFEENGKVSYPNIKYKINMIPTSLNVNNGEYKEIK